MKPDFALPARSLSASLIAGSGHHAAVIERLYQARHSIWIATANLKELMIEDHVARPGRRRTTRRGGARNFRTILSLFEELVGRGLDLRILHASPPSRVFLRDEARLAGLKPRQTAGHYERRLCPRVHIKTVIIDGARAYLGSANFTGAGLGARGEDKRNFELGLVSEDDQLLDNLQALFDHLWQGRPCATCKLQQSCPAPIAGADKPAG